MQNAFVESFNGRLRDECLNENLFGNLAEARRIIETWRIDYNTHTPHTFAERANTNRVRPKTTFHPTGFARAPQRLRSAGLDRN